MSDTKFIGCEIDKETQNKVIWALRDFGKKADKAVQDVVNRTSIAIEVDAKNKLKDDGHIITSRLRSSIHAEVRGGYLRGTEDRVITRMGGFRYTDKDGNSYDGDLKEPIGEFEALAGTNVEYAAAMEFGSKGHTIYPKNGSLLAFQMSTATSLKSGKSLFFNKKTGKFNVKKSDNTMIFAKYVKIPPQPARSFLGYAAEKQRPKFVQRMTDALNKLIQSEQRV